MKHYKLPICVVPQREKAELTWLFSPSSSALGKHPMVFNPMNECVALPQLKKKKSVVRPVNHDVKVFSTRVNVYSTRSEEEFLKK